MRPVTAGPSTRPWFHALSAISVSTQALRLA